MAFDYGDRTTWGTGSCNNNCGIPGEQSEDINLAKRQCTYRELALVHGPYFLWCSVSELEKETRWVKDMLDEGVEYEEGVEYKEGVEYEEGVESEEGVEDARMANHSLQNAQAPQMIMLVGEVQKTASIQKLGFGMARAPNHSGDIRLSVDLETTRWESPVLIADCELHVPKTFRRIIAGKAPLGITRRSLT
ncbi:hypothetical protein VE02_06910 [Pseudogymnoascus sp. 03VT05]|nr:hypothetical protein VE02_06910 [Pseudogymnoascus sp. 03VT05]